MLGIFALFLGIYISMAQERAVKDVKQAEVSRAFDARAITAADLKAAVTAVTFQTDTIYWFAVNIISGDGELPSQQQVSSPPVKPTPQGSCDPDNEGSICSVQLNVTSVTDIPAYNALISRITMGTKPTIAEFLATGASQTNVAREL